MMLWFWGVHQRETTSIRFCQKSSEYHSGLHQVLCQYSDMIGSAFVCVYNIFTYVTGSGKRDILEQMFILSNSQIYGLQYNNHKIFFLYLQSLYYLSAKSDALNPILFTEALCLSSHHYPNLAIWSGRFFITAISQLRVSNAHNSGMKRGMCTLSISMRRQFFALSSGI